MPWVYIVQCHDDSFYTGSTWDLHHRFNEHVQGKACAHTRRRRPVKLAWAQEFERIDDAYILEHQIKGWSRQKKIALIEERLDLLPSLARKGIEVIKNPLSAEARERIEQNTTAISNGGLVDPSRADFVPAPLDAITRQGVREWAPRSGRFDRLRQDRPEGLAES